MLRGAVAVFVTGAAVMVAELIAARLTAPHYGQSTATWAALAGVTLLGVTLGNLLGGILAQRAKRPLLVSAFGALAGAATLVALPSSLAAIARIAGPDNGGLFLFALAAFLPPTAFLGLVSPAVAAAFVRADRNGSDLGALYLASMLGYMLGSAAAGLYLPFVFPAPTVCRLAAVGLVVAGGVLLASRQRGEMPQTASAPTWRMSLAFCAAQRMTLLHVFAIGFVGMATELALARLVTPVLGGSHIVWSSVFITFIGFMGPGGWLGGKVADKVSSRIPSWALYAALGLALYLTVLFQTRALGLWTMGYEAALRIALHVLVGFAPYAFTLGFLSAFLLQKATVRAIGGGDRACIGLVYAVNGVGSSCGSFFAGMLFTGSASLLAALPGAERPLPAEIAVVDLERVVFRGESGYNSVTVTQKKDDQHAITIWLDRIPHTTVDTGVPATLNASYTRLLDVAVDVLCPSEGCRAFVIGGGGYALPRKWNGERRKYAEVTVAEIDPLVSSCAHRFMDAPADNEVVHDNVVDGRCLADRFAREGQTNRFDVVVGDTIGDAAIPYHLTTREFFAQIRDSLLKPDGVYLMHVLDVLDDPGLLSSVVKTLKSVYPHVIACSYSGVRDVRQSFVVAASNRPMAARPLGEALLARYPEAVPIVLGESECAALSGRDGALLLTDDFAPVERFVWRVMSRDVQYRAYALSDEMMKTLDEGDDDAAYALALRVLEMQPEQPRALEVVVDAAEYGREGAEEVARNQAMRPSTSPDAKIRYAVCLKKMGRQAEALPIWRELVRRWPRNPEYAATLKDLEK